MAYVKGCDMRGMLSFQILWLLSKKDMHGEGIAAEIERRRGEKPKAGTLYPALKDLSGRGLILGKKSGKTITYSLTSKGKATMKEAKTYFVRCFGEILASG
ncbi:MAG: PadR family transcriptional regulator [Candidatus Micrarchaeota archaeon]|nr:PadR family transcriptional regulator [Candidatus Micrarchaeota archaeon]MDE1834285.1 PadR family transcriptional regulator [Candidatus Micrarchaeota archaeon]MDE1859462.1 PadR family transcriptional regulator [Candidatus Micrarchaeota archaeon]